MDKIFEANTSGTPPSGPGTATGYPSDGDIDAGEPATVPGAYWFWMITAELLALIIGAGIAPNGSVLSQVYAAVVAIAGEAASAAQTAAESFATTAATAAQSAAETFATSAATAAQTAAQTTVLGWFTGSNQSLGTTGFQQIPGGLLLQRVTVAVPGAGGNEVTITYPIAYTTYADIPIPAVQDPAVVGDESNFLGLSVTAHSLTGCTIGMGQNGGGTRDVTLTVFVSGEL